MSTVQAEAAVSAVRDYLVSLLCAREWCTARSVGRALEQLIDSMPKRSALLPSYDETAKKECETAYQERPPLLRKG